MVSEVNANGAVLPHSDISTVEVGAEQRTIFLRPHTTEQQTLALTHTGICITRVHERTQIVVLRTGNVLGQNRKTITQLRVLEVVHSVVVGLAEVTTRVGVPPTLCILSVESGIPHRELAPHIVGVTRTHPRQNEGKRRALGVRDAGLVSPPVTQSDAKHDHATHGRSNTTTRSDALTLVSGERFRQSLEQLDTVLSGVVHFRVVAEEKSLSAFIVRPRQALKRVALDRAAQRVAQGANGGETRVGFGLHVHQYTRSPQSLLPLFL